jgi:two-component system cell cycle response regulator
MAIARILAVDDSAEVRRQIDAALRSDNAEIEVIPAADGMAGFKILMGGGIDLVLCDLVMPGIDGLKFLDLKKSRPELAEIPVLLLTAVDQVESKVMGLERGAQDYIAKPFDPRELIARVGVHLQLKKTRDELTAKNQLLERLSSTDDLTGLANRRHFFAALEKELERARRHRNSLSLVAFDLDRFKSVNDTFGHAEGDRVLKAVSAVMLEHIRRYDLAVRLGGEELALLLPETVATDAQLLAERIRAAVETQVKVGGGKRAITLSGGVAGWNGEGEDGASLLKRADEALYKAKAGGRNRIELS